jgi:hypothetical protein
MGWNMLPSILLTLHMTKDTQADMPLSCFEISGVFWNTEGLPNQDPECETVLETTMRTSLKSCIIEG